jgi:hypothetical protein
MARFGQAMIDVVLGTGELERMRPEDLAAGHRLFDQRGGRTGVARCGEVSAVVGENRMDLVRHGGDQRPQKVPRHTPCGFLMQLGKGELGRAINGHKQVESALFRVHLGDIDMEVADRVALELLLGGRVAGHLGQAADPMALQTAMQGRARQVRDGGLEGVEAIVQRQQGVLAEGDDDRLFLDREHRGMRCSRPRRAICGGIPLPPFGDGLRVDAMALGQGSQARLTILYCSTDCLCRCGAPMENLAHSASLHSGDKNAPSNPGIKQKHFRPNLVRIQLLRSSWRTPLG